MRPSSSGSSVSAPSTSVPLNTVRKCRACPFDPAYRPTSLEPAAYFASGLRRGPPERTRRHMRLRQALDRFAPARLGVVIGSAVGAATGLEREYLVFSGSGLHRDGPRPPVVGIDWSATPPSRSAPAP